MSSIHVFMVCFCMLAHISNFFTVNCIDSKTSAYERLRKDILSRPVVTQKIPPGITDDFASPYPLNFQLMPLAVYDLDEIRQAATVVVIVSIKWSQKELSWNTTEYNGLDKVWIDRDSVWTPKVVVIMGQQDSLSLDLQETLELWSNGTLFSSGPYYLSFTCNIDFDKYPFDIQACSVSFYPLGTDGVPEVSITDYEFTLANVFTMTGEWSLVSITPEIVNTSSQNENGPVLYNYPRYTFIVRRNCVFYVLTIIFPMVLSSSLFSFVFLIPTHSGEKFSFLISVYTSIAIFLSYISDVMPRSLSRLPYLACLLIEVLTEGFISLLCTLLVVRKHGKENNAAEVAYKMLSHPMSPSGRRESHSDVDVNQNSGTHIRRWPITSQNLDVAFFFLSAFGQTSFVILLFTVSDWLSDYSSS